VDRDSFTYYCFVFEMVKKMWLYLLLVCLGRKTCVSYLCFYFPHILQWLYNWAWTSPNILAKAFICVFPKQNTYTLFPISYVHHVITDWRKSKCGIWVGSGGIICVWGIVETGQLVQYHSASPKCLSLCSEILTAASNKCLDTKEILLVHYSKSRIMWCTYTVCILNLITFVCMKIHIQTHIHTYVVQPKSSRNLNAARKPLVVQLWASGYRELYPLWTSLPSGVVLCWTVFFFCAFL
jgi:hypothetical protein